MKDKSGAAATISHCVDFVNLPQVAEGAEGAALYTRYFQKRLDTIQAIPGQVDQIEAYNDFIAEDFLAQADPAPRKTAIKSLTDMTKDPALKREQLALQKYRSLLAFEQQAGTAKDKLVAATGYRDLAKAYKEMRAGTKAAGEFERLRSQLEGAKAGGPKS